MKESNCDDATQMQLEFLVEQLRKATGSKFAIVVIGDGDGETRSAVTVPETPDRKKHALMMGEIAHGISMVAASIVSNGSNGKFELLMKDHKGDIRPVIDDDVDCTFRWGKP